MRTTVYIGTSLGGFMARTDGNLDWLTRFANAEAVDAYEEFMNQIDAMVIGKGTFEKILINEKGSKPPFAMTRFNL